ncbi:excinuclease ABC subunit C [candidate division KSB1 bacterium]|nr:excinuclease ABC subunit C [candidate division KSB1 bacterium]
MKPRVPEKLQEKLDHLSRNPGVYLFKDHRGDVIYVGKAKILRNRVRSYFQVSRVPDLKTSRLVEKIADFETIVTDSELEALILEANLVKEYRPRYNINLKDDKSFPYIRVTNEPFPRLFATRKIVRDGSRYFGPYTDVASMRELLKTIKRMFPIRSCNFNLTPENIAAKKFKICLDYHIKKCHGPCEGLINREEYGQIIDYVVGFILGKSNRVVEEIKHRMQEAATNRRFEQAARLRDQLQTIEAFRMRQKVVDANLRERDIIALAKDDADACCVVFRLREGKIIGRQHFYLNGIEDEDASAITAAFIKQFYALNNEVPAEILLPAALGDEKSPIQAWLSQKRKGAVELTAPVRGEKAQLIRMCEKNAGLLLQELLLQKEKNKDYVPGSVQALQRDLHLDKLPVRIEAFDISNIQGTDPVASMVCFINGKAQRSQYRRFRIRSKAAPDDFAMMREVVGRRYKRQLQEKGELPDLILIDGGKGQLNAALQALRELHIAELPIAALAKRLDEIYLPGSADPVNVRRDSAGLRLLQRLRDEAHRFAVTYHRTLRKRRTLLSELQSIEGVGAVRRNLLIRHFKSVAKLKNASSKDIATVEGISQSLAEKIWHFYHPQRTADDPHVS